MEPIRQFIALYIEPWSSLLGVLVIIPAVWTWWEVTYGRRRRHRRWFDQVRAASGERPSLLIVDLLPERDIHVGVEAFRQTDADLRKIPTDRIFSISRSNRLGPTDMAALTVELRQRAADILKAGTDTVHVFYAGPVVPMALIGAEFANLCRVQLYQHHQTGYESWGPLRHDEATV